MKAPKKIYRTTTYLDNDRGKTLWKKAPVAGAENIEYIRKDAVVEWLKEFNDYHYIMRYSDCSEVSLDQLIDGFKNYMTEEKV